ncbi:MAG TPA: diguanylate cyclase [Terriglobales bacterium]|nr:diguanylate cyclase [Terriglobales bacterium]
MADRAEIAKRVAQAEKLLQRGKTGEALDEYLQILVDDPENDNVRSMAADLCLSLSRTGEAVTLLGELFERQVAMGEATRASLTYKKLVRHGNPTWQQKFRFGQLLENSNKKLAVGTYENALDDLVRQNKPEESLEVLARIVLLEPSQANHLRLAELCSQLGDRKHAAAAFLKTAELAEAGGQDAAQYYERGYAEDPSDPRIALAYGKSLLAQGQVGASIFILEPHVLAGNPSIELREHYAQALLSANRLSEAEPFVWQLFEQNPNRLQQVAGLIGQLVDAQQDAEAVALARKLEQFQRRRGERRAFVAMMQDLVGRHRASPEMLEFLSELFNASNRETDYCQTLLKLFDLYVSTGNFPKAAECLDRAAEVDPYERGHQRRLEMLRGRIEEGRYKVIASRLAQMNKSVPEPIRTEEPTLGAAALQDLMLQAEILVQYGMRSKAVERLQRIQELFPREEERNEDLQRLYLAAGMTPRYAGRTPVPQAPAAPPLTLPPTQLDVGDVSSFTRVAEITRKLYHQNNPNAVLSTAANEMGSQWKVTRCVAAMRKPGLPPTALQEYRVDGISAGDPAALAALVAACQDLAIARGTVTIGDALTAKELQPVRRSVAELGITSVLALPLSEGEEHVGVLLFLQGHARNWQPAEIVVLKTLAEQLVIALNNAGLRKLVRNLSVTDEKSGLLKRASYLDLVQAETRRAMQQATPLTILLMHFGRFSALCKEFGEPAVEAMMEQVGQLFSANIRTNDVAFRYDTMTVALILGDTAEKEGLLAVEKLRKLIAEVRLPGKDQPVTFTAGLAEAVMKANYDPVDVVTEVINRVEQALHDALAQGLGSVLALAANLSAAAVA